MSIFDANEDPQLSEQQDDQVLGMISDLIGQANINYLKTLVASGKRDADQVWSRFHEGFALDEDINSLAIFHAFSELSDHRHQKQQ